MINTLQLIFNRLSIVKIDAWVYRHDQLSLEETQYVNPRLKKLNLQPKPFNFRKDILQYQLYFKGNHAHNSLFFYRGRVLAIIGKKGPLIGDSETFPDFRGKGLFPHTIRSIAEEQVLDKGISEIFILVRPENYASIKGIEKAGFQRIYYIRALRFLWFYFNRKVKTIDGSK